MAALSCVWWNVENLYPFDPSFQPNPGDSWPSERPHAQVEYDDKLDALADVLNGMPGGPPDLLMLGEVATKSAVGGRDALDDLAGRLPGKRGHHLCATGDSRGITCGAIWNADKLEEFGNAQVHPVTSVTGAKVGRPIVELHMRDRASKSEFIVYLNHWTARRDDSRKANAERSRELASEELIRLLQERLCVGVGLQADPDTRIVAVGDFNDEPFSDSLTQYHYAVRDKKQVIERDPTTGEPLLYNPCWRLLGQKLACHVRPPHQPPQWLPAGSHRFDRPMPSQWSTWSTFDQVLVSTGMVKGAKPAFQDSSLEVYCTHRLLDSTGKPAGPSDHLPIRFALQF
jgi:endonuclease/exonuclease/phosphatase family metal-dependent hydrolase